MMPSGYYQGTLKSGCHPHILDEENSCPRGSHTLNPSPKNLHWCASCLPSLLLLRVSLVNSGRASQQDGPALPEQRTEAQRGKLFS